MSVILTTDYVPAVMHPDGGVVNSSMLSHLQTKPFCHDGQALASRHNLIAYQYLTGTTRLRCSARSMQ